MQAAKTSKIQRRLQPVKRHLLAQNHCYDEQSEGTMHTTTRKIAFAFALCLISGGTSLLTPASAQSDFKEILVQDFGAFYQECPGPASSYSPKCSNELASLTSRQHALNLSDDDLNTALQQAQGTRGGFRGGFR